MNTLLKEILQWLQMNNYRRASFDRLVGIIPSAATYQQLNTLVDTHPHIFRPATMKGGLPGLALLDHVDVAKFLASEETEAAPLLVQVESPDTLAEMDPPAAPAAPKVTDSAVEAEIADEYYRNLGSALKCPEGSPVNNVTLCVLVLRNGFTIVGKSACVNSANFNEDIGRTLAREDAIRQVWPYLGFRLADTRTAA